MANVNVAVRALTRPSTQIKARIAGLEQELGALLRRKAEELRDDMRIEPPPRPDSTYYDKRGHARTRRGYVRTHKLSNSWQVKPVAYRSGMLVSGVFNDVTDPRGRQYASFVQGPLEGEHHQVPRFGREYLWTSISTAHRRRGQELAQEVRRALQDVHVAGE